MQNRTRHYFIFRALIPLLLGWAIYLLAADTPLAVFHLDWQPRGVFFRFVRNYLCDALWAYALTMTVCGILGQTKRAIGGTAVLCVATETLLEFAQRLPFVRGTFDGWDIFIQIIATAIALVDIIYCFKVRKRRKTK